MRSVVVTSCTGRKRASSTVPATLSSNDVSSLDGLVHSWLNTVRNGQAAWTIGDLYVGRSVVEANFVSDFIAAELCFISTGLGLVKASERWPSYDLTVSKGDGSIVPTLDGLGATSADWWNAINARQGKPNPLSSLLSSSSVDLVLLALPSGYLEMISDDINRTSRTNLGKLRVFTSTAGVEFLPAGLKQCAMPYDDRLEAIRPGTRLDFPQRAMRHFVESLGGHHASLHVARTAVSNSMGQLVAPRVPPRSRASDEDIARMLAQHWSRCEGQSSRLLRFLRDEALVACEQGRFRDLWRQVRSNIESEVAHG